MVRFIVFGLSALLLLALVGIVGAGGVFWYYGRDLPDYRTLADYEPPVTTRLYAGDGRLMSEYAVEKRIFVPIEAIPRPLIDAFLAAEDKNFYTHWGIDPVGLGRAVLTNLKNVGSDRRPVGASTITQQVAKNFFLTSEVSLDRKIKEAILTMRIEQAYTKDKILELYMNDVSLGFRSYGVAAAALNYFNKSLDQLTIADAAFLAALLKAPNNYNPVRRHQAALDRRNWVISRMLEDGRITADQAREATDDPLRVCSPDKTKYLKSGAYFAEEVRRQLVSSYGEDYLYKGGLAVRTTLDPTYQHLATTSLRTGLEAYDRRHGWRGPVDHAEVPKKAEKALWRAALTAVSRPPGMLKEWRLAIVLDVAPTKATLGLPDGATATLPLKEMKWARAWHRKQYLGPVVRQVGDVLDRGDVVMVEPVDGEEFYALRQIPNVNGGMIVLDPHTGRVLAMVGGWSFKMSEFNRATQALRQPGSAFKPFVYLTALENGYSPSTLVLDAPFVYDQGPGLPKWRPKNYEDEYFGPLTLRIGLEKSLNLMTVRLAQSVGMEKIAKTAELFAVDDHFPRLLAASLGAGETTLLRLATAYGMLANGGKRLDPTLIDRIQNRHGKTIYKHDTRPCEACKDVFWTGQSVPTLPDTRQQVSDPRSIYQIVHIMEGVIQRGTGRRLAALGVPLAGKTGTTNGSVDTWFLGFTPDLLAAVFVGFDEPRSLGRHEEGARTALPVFKAFMEEALKNKSVRPFPVPAGIQFLRVHHDTGQLAQPGDSPVIREAFKTGNSPGYVARTVLDGSAPLDIPLGAPSVGTLDGFVAGLDDGQETRQGDESDTSGMINDRIDEKSDGVGENTPSPMPTAMPQQESVAPYQAEHPNRSGAPLYPFAGSSKNTATQPQSGGLY